MSPHEHGRDRASVGRKRLSHIIGMLCLTSMASVATCDRAPTDGGPMSTRSYRMGFSHIPPSPDQTTAIASLEMWRKRADAALMHMNVQWAAMLGGKSAVDAAR